jgi:uncharacterized GH25 family protein
MKKISIALVMMLSFVVRSQSFTPDMDKNPIDSLKGFNESEVRERLKFNNVVGQELENHIKQLKRDYINQKFFTVRRKDEKSN